MPYKGFGWNYEIFFFLKDRYQCDSCKLVSGLYTWLSVFSEEKANKVTTALANGTSFETVLGTYGEGDKTLQSIGRGDYESEVEEVIFQLDDEEVSDCIVTDSGYYFVKCIDKYNEELSETNKSNVISKRKEQVITDMIAEQNVNYYSAINEKLWDKIEIDEDITTENFFTVLENYISY